MTQLVEERAEIGTLVAKAAQLEVSEELFCQFVERQSLVLYALFVVECRMNRFLNEGTCQLVMGTDDEPQGLHQDVDGQRRIQSERFIAHDVDVWSMLGHVFGNHRNVAVGTHEYGHFVLWYALTDEVLQYLGDAAECLLQIVVGSQQLYTDKACWGLVGGYLLLHFGTGPFQLVSFWRLLQFVILQLGSFREESIVELGNHPFRTPVHLQLLQLYHILRELLLNVVQQSPVAASPAVDALLDISHDEVLAAFVAHGFQQKYAEVLPLDGGRVLELVYHDVLQLGTYLLEDKR